MRTHKKVLRTTSIAYRVVCLLSACAFLPPEIAFLLPEIVFLDTEKIQLHIPLCGVPRGAVAFFAYQGQNPMRPFKMPPRASPAAEKQLVWKTRDLPEFLSLLLQ